MSLHDLPGPDPDPGPDLDVDQGPVVGLPTAADDQGLGRVDADVPDPERDVIAPDPGIGIIDPSRGRVVARDRNPERDVVAPDPSMYK